MSVEADLVLLQDELNCLKKKYQKTVTTSGGHMSSLTAPGSSVYPDEYYEECECDTPYVYQTYGTPPCPTSADAGQGSLGDLGGKIVNPAEGRGIGGLFVFDAIRGVFYKAPDSELYENRNGGLEFDDLEHGIVDPWWWKKQDPSQDGVILWTCGRGYVRRSINSGKTWTDVSPIWGNRGIKYSQVIPDIFSQNTFYVVSGGYTGTYINIHKTQDNGVNWETHEIRYQNVEDREPIWAELSGINANHLWLTTWCPYEAYELFKINTITFDIDYYKIVCGATYDDRRNHTIITHPHCPIDSTDLYLYGRMGTVFEEIDELSHIVKYDGEEYTVIEDSWEYDWVGSLRTSLMNENGDRNFYTVRNVGSTRDSDFETLGCMFTDIMFDFRCPENIVWS